MGAMTTELPPPWRMMRLLDGYITTQLLYVAAKLDIASVLAGGPKSGAEIAVAVGADRDALVRVMRGLVIEDVLAEDADGRFVLTPVGECLTSLRGATVARAELYYDSAAALLDTVVGGGTAFERVHGEQFFEHLGRHPARDAVFEASMAGRAEQEARDVVEAFDFSGIDRLVDVGGGRGVLLAAVLGANPSLFGVLLDREAAITTARASLQAAGLGDRTDCVAGDFFVEVPEQADAYLLSRVIHDWDDADARRILATCRQAMRPDSRLLIVEAILPERARDRPAAIRMDLHMLLLLGARERTETEFRTLLDSSGFNVTRVVMTASPAGLGVVEATLT
jgi:SAM-dependent methyltransferase